MRKYIYIAIGGFFGAILRYLIRTVQIENYRSAFPVATLLINLTGCFLLAFFFTVTMKRLSINADLKLGVATGFLGAFTTFSTFCKEITVIALQGYPVTALFYMTASVVFGLVITYLGYQLAVTLVNGHQKRTSGEPAEKRSSESEEA